jgi:hypothetical protein
LICNLDFEAGECSNAGDRPSGASGTESTSYRLSNPARGSQCIGERFHQRHGFGVKLDQEIERSAGKSLCRATGISVDWIYRGSRAGLPYELACKLLEAEVITRSSIPKSSNRNAGRGRWFSSNRHRRPERGWIFNAPSSWAWFSLLRPAARRPPAPAARS